MRNRLDDLAAVSKILADVGIEILNGSFSQGAGKFLLNRRIPTPVVPRRFEGFC
jgi:hypothetical protein